MLDRRQFVRSVAGVSALSLAARTTFSQETQSAGFGRRPDNAIESEDSGIARGRARDSEAIRCRNGSRIEVACRVSRV